MYTDGINVYICKRLHVAWPPYWIFRVCVCIFSALC